MPTPEPLSSPSRIIRHEHAGVVDGQPYGVIAGDLAILNNNERGGEFPARGVVADALATLANLDQVVPARREPEHDAALGRIAALHAQVGAALMALGVEVPPHG